MIKEKRRTALKITQDQDPKLKLKPGKVVDDEMARLCAPRKTSCAKRLCEGQNRVKKHMLNHGSGEEKKGWEIL